MKKLLLILALGISANAWTEEEFNLTCNLKEVHDTVIVEYTKEGPKFKSWFSLDKGWVDWIGEIPNERSEQDLTIKPTIKEYNLQIVFNEDMKGYIYSGELTDYEKIKINKRASSQRKTRIDIWTKGIFLRSENIIINRLDGFIYWWDRKRKFLGSCISANN